MCESKLQPAACCAAAVLGVVWVGSPQTIGCGSEQGSLSRLLAGSVCRLPHSVVEPRSPSLDSAPQAVHCVHDVLGRSKRAGWVLPLCCPVCCSACTYRSQPATLLRSGFCCWHCSAVLVSQMTWPVLHWQL